MNLACWRLSVKGFTKICGEWKTLQTSIHLYLSIHLKEIKLQFLGVSLTRVNWLSILECNTPMAPFTLGTSLWKRHPRKTPSLRQWGRYRGKSSFRLTLLMKLQTRLQYQSCSVIGMNVNLMLTAIQALSFAFMLGFLPPWACSQFQMAKESNLLNDLGQPNISIFTAYAYSAGLHLNWDICISHGWVFSRSEEVCLIYIVLWCSTYTFLQVKRHESNFMYGDYKLVIELSPHWF